MHSGSKMLHFISYTSHGNIEPLGMGVDPTQVVHCKKIHTGALSAAAAAEFPVGFLKRNRSCFQLTPPRSTLENPVKECNDSTTSDKRGRSTYAFFDLHSLPSSPKRKEGHGYLMHS